MKYYPVETIAAMLNSVMGTNEKVANYIKFAESLGIQVLPPDINEGYSKFTVKGDKIRFGLAAIKNVGYNVVESIVNTRSKKSHFESLMDFINKIDLSGINKRAIESLIKAGTFDCFNVYRSRLLAVYEKLMDGVANERKRNIDGQISLFGLEEEVNSLEIKYPNIKEFAKKNLLSMEKEMTGLYISGHPLDEYNESLKVQTSTTIEKIYESYELIKETYNANDLPKSIIHDEEKVILGGIIAEANQKITRSNNLMAFLKLEDLTNTIEVIVFPKTLDKVREFIKEDGLVVIKGRVSIKEDELPKLICETIGPLEKINTSKVYIRVGNMNEGRELIKTLKTMPFEYKGDTTLYIFTANDRKNYRMARDMWINLESDAMSYFRELVGNKNVKIIE